MNWLIDSDVLIEGERGNPLLHAWLERSQNDAVAVSDGVVGEFLLGVHAVADAEKRERGNAFFQEVISGLARLSNDPEDYAMAARLAGKAWREGKGRPGLLDGLLAALAIRIGAKVATRNLKDFEAMGCPCENPLAVPGRA